MYYKISVYSLSHSISSLKVRDLSPLGTKIYSAPEVVTNIRKVVKKISSSFHFTPSTAATKECVSDFAIVADGTFLSLIVS